MVEQEKEDQEQANTGEDNNTGNISKKNSLIEQADAIAKRLEDANQKAEELYKKQEELMARQMLGGKSEAGDSEPKKEESPKEYADKVMNGSIK